MVRFTSSSYASGKRRMFCGAIAIVVMSIALGVTRAQGTWSTAQLSVSRYLLAAASVDDVAIFAGGYANAGADNIPDPASDAVDLYNITTQTWSTSLLSVARGSLAAASVGSVAIFAGGHTAAVVNGLRVSDLSNAVDLYNRITRAWSTAQGLYDSASEPRGHGRRLSYGIGAIAAEIIGAVLG